jgi:hypothetical protein
VPVDLRRKVLGVSHFKNLKGFSMLCSEYARYQPETSMNQPAITSISSAKPTDSNHPLVRMERALRSELTKVWPTRRVPLCPPAFAALVDGASLKPLEVESGPTLVLYLPEHFKPHAASLVHVCPSIRIHQDIGLKTQAAYLSWRSAMDGRELPPTVWVLVDDLSNFFASNLGRLQVIFVVGQEVHCGGFEPDPEYSQRALATLQRCHDFVSDADTALMESASKKAAAYGDRPWLFMTYELKSLNERLAVSWAPLRTLRACS